MSCCNVRGFQGSRIQFQWYQRVALGKEVTRALSGAECFLLTCFQGWPLTANQEVRQSFHVGGCKISAAKDSNNAVARSRYIGEIKKQLLNRSSSHITYTEASSVAFF